MATLGLKEMGKFLWEGREYGGERNGHWIDILTYLHTYILTYLHTYILTYSHTYLLTYLFPLIFITSPDGRIG